MKVYLVIMKVYLAGPDVFLPDANDIGRRKAEVSSREGRLLDAQGLPVEDFGLPDNLMMTHALDLPGCAPLTPGQAPADIWHDLTAFDAGVRMAAQRGIVMPAGASS
jgi:hypothetical protein